MEDESWVFDSLICFLNGPIWNAPLQSFVEEKSLFFEPNIDDNDDYKQIFDDYKGLVDFMLGSFMEDLGITPEQFEDACNKGQQLFLTFDHNLFEQIWAANDYEIFKRMMTQKNVELQLQALELIEQKYGITPQCFIPNKKKFENLAIVGTSKDNDIDKFVEIKLNENLENDIMVDVTEKFTKNEPDSENSEELKLILEEKEVLKKALEDKKEELVNQTVVDISYPRSENLDKKEINLLKYESKSPIVNEVNPDELKKRQDYLRAQRDKLVALKKESRQKHLNNENYLKDKLKIRPKSAKAAEALLSGEKITPSQLQIRKTLAERLKSEVVEKK